MDMCTKRHVYENVHHSTVHNIPRLKAAQVFISSRKDNILQYVHILLTIVYSLLYRLLYSNENNLSSP